MRPFAVRTRHSFSDSSRDFALDSTWNWQRRAALAVADLLPAAAGATAAAGKGLSTAGWLRCISMKLTAAFCSVIPRFLKGIRERLRSWWVPARSETFKRFSLVVSPGQVLRRDGPSGTRFSPSSPWCSRQGLLRVSLWSSLLEPNSCSPQCSLQCSLQSVFDPPRVRMGFLSEKRRSPARGGSWVSGCRFLRQERR